LESPKIKKIKSLFDKRKAGYVTEIWYRASDEKVLASVPSTAIADKAQGGKTSRRQMEFLKKAAKRDFDIELEFLIYRGEQHESLEAGLWALLKDKFPKQVLACFVSLPKAKEAEVWLELKEKEKSAPMGLSNLKNLIRDYLGIFGIHLKEIFWTGADRERPSLPVILKTVKELAPSTVPEIGSKLVNDGFEVPTESWLRAKLDLLRKKQMIIRQPGGEYAVTEVGHRSIPHGTYRSSSDVQRALALAKKRW